MRRSAATSPRPWARPTIRPCTVTLRAPFDDGGKTITGGCTAMRLRCPALAGRASRRPPLPRPPRTAHRAGAPYAPAASVLHGPPGTRAAAGANPSTGANRLRRTTGPCRRDACAQRGRGDDGRARGGGRTGTGTGTGRARGGTETGAPPVRPPPVRPPPPCRRASRKPTRPADVDTSLRPPATAVRPNTATERGCPRSPRQVSAREQALEEKWTCVQITAPN